MRASKGIFLAAALLLATFSSGCTSEGPAVRGWVETVVIPTYPVGPASEFPSFGRRDIYPYTRQDDMSFDRQDMGYEAYKLENEYLRIEVLPALGGRMFAMYDRVTAQDVLFRQVSIKPGLVGLRGAWICGGIEWNFPRSHSVTTHDLVSCQLIRDDDGSATIVVGDTERCFGMSWTVKLRLRPGQACVETSIICRNRTSVPHKAYWWSNATFPANDRTQLVFPFHKVAGHGGGGLLDWPIRDGKDVSWYKEHRSATSTFRAAGDENFMAAYDHGRDVALAQYADHRVMPGRKWWTWGVGPSGMRWADILTDDHRAYVEIQSGCPLTQSQQFDIQPHEEREFKEYWIPITRIGLPARVNPQAVVRLTAADGVATVGVLATRRIDGASIELSADGKTLKRWRKDISPKTAFVERVNLGGAEPASLHLRVADAAGAEVIAHTYGKYAPGEPLIDPRQRRRRRDSGAAPGPQTLAERLDEAVGKIKQGLPAEGKAAIEKLQGTEGVDADVARYYLGVAEARLGRSAEALKQLEAVRPASKLGAAAAIEAARLLLAEGSWQKAFDRLKPLTQGRSPHATVAVYAAIAMRKMGRTRQAEALLEKALRRDPLMLLGQVELALLLGRGVDGLTALRDEQKRIEAATGYMAIRQYDVAEMLLRPAPGSVASATAAYLRAHVATLAGKAAEADRLRKQARRASVRGCMPSRLAELAAFDASLAAEPNDAGAVYLAGLILYTKGRQQDAMARWRRAEKLGHEDAAVYHCIGRALLRDNPDEAIRHLERAAQKAPDALQVYLDLDQAYQQTGKVDKRIQAMEGAVARMPRRHELAHNLALAYFDAGRYDEAVKIYTSRKFRVAEAEYDLHDDYAMALMGRAVKHLAAGRDDKALADLAAALEYPENLSIGRPERARGGATIHFWRGVALDKQGKAALAKQAWTQAAALGRMSRRVGPWRPMRSLDIVHAAMAMRRLGQGKQADELVGQLKEVFERFEDYRPPQGKAYVAFLRGYLAAGEGRTAEAEKDFKQAEDGLRAGAGYLRLARAWAKLLGKPKGGAK